MSARNEKVGHHLPILRSFRTNKWIIYTIQIGHHFTLHILILIAWRDAGVQYFSSFFVTKYRYSLRFLLCCLETNEFVENFNIWNVATKWCLSETSDRLYQTPKTVLRPWCCWKTSRTIFIPMKIRILGIYQESYNSPCIKSCNCTNIKVWAEGRTQHWYSQLFLNERLIVKLI